MPDLTPERGHPVSFGALPPLPDGYFVAWHEEHEHYQAHGPDEWESVITVDRFQARRWAIAHWRNHAN